MLTLRIALDADEEEEKSKDNVEFGDIGVKPSKWHSTTKPSAPTKASTNRQK